MSTLNLCSLFGLATRAPSRLSERGATLTGYALTMSAMAVIGLGSLTLLEDNSAAFLSSTGDDIGAPRESASEIRDTDQGISFGDGTGSSSPIDPTTGNPTEPGTTVTLTGNSFTTAGPSGSPLAKNPYAVNAAGRCLQYATAGNVLIPRDCSGIGKQNFVFP